MENLSFVKLWEKIKSWLYKVFVDSLAQAIARNVATVLDEKYSEKRLEFEKYRFDEENKTRIREKNLELPSYCPKCDVFMTDEERTSKGIKYRCKSCDYTKHFEEKSVNVLPVTAYNKHARGTSYDPFNY